MIHMSKQVGYAVQLLTALSKLKKNEYLSLKIFSNESKISFLFLQKIARTLKLSKIIDAERGVHGGYFLLRDPKKISLKEIIEIIDGQFGLTDCMRGDDCPRKEKCKSKKMFKKVNEKIEKVLSETMII